MLLNEINIGGIYVITLDVHYRTHEEVRKTQFLIKVINAHSENGGIVEFVFLNSTDNAGHYAYPKQIKPVV